MHYEWGKMRSPKDFGENNTDDKLRLMWHYYKLLYVNNKELLTILHKFLGSC